MAAAETTAQRELHLLYNDHHGWLQGWLRKKLDSRADAADLAHDTFLRAFTSRQLGQIVEPRAFLATLARRVLCNFWRRRELDQAYLNTLATLPAGCVPSEEDLALVREALVAIDRLLHGLPPKVRQAFLLSRLEGLTHVQIAAALELSVATIERYLKQAFAHCWLGLGELQE
jgi:RNA polymerase sigma-70 factor (ECF subfamily)